MAPRALMGHTGPNAACYYGMLELLPAARCGVVLM
jgi:hypothetical protein